MSERRGGRTLVLTLAAALLAVLLMIHGAGRPAPPRAVEPPARPAAPRPPTRAAPSRAEPPVRPPRAASAANAAPRITSATLDRTSLCPGESTLLRMSAEDPDDDDLSYQATFLSTALGSPRFGFGRWLRVVAPPQAGRYQVVAAVEDRARARDELPLELDVRACDPAPFDVSLLRIQHVELDATVHQFDLREARDVARRAGKTLEGPAGASATASPRTEAGRPATPTRSR